MRDMTTRECSSEPAGDGKNLSSFLQKNGDQHSVQNSQSRKKRYRNNRHEVRAKVMEQTSFHMTLRNQSKNRILKSKNETVEIEDDRCIINKTKTIKANGVGLKRKSVSRELETTAKKRKESASSINAREVKHISTQTSDDPKEETESKHLTESEISVKQELHVPRDTVQSAIRKVLLTFVDHMDPKKITDRMLESNNYRPAILRDIMDNGNTSDRNRKLLDLISRSDLSLYTHFKQCLLDTKQIDLLKLLEIAEKDGDTRDITKNITQNMIQFNSEGNKLYTEHMASADLRDRKIICLEYEIIGKIVLRALLEKKVNDAKPSNEKSLIWTIDTFLDINRQSIEKIESHIVKFGINVIFPKAKLDSWGFSLFCLILINTCEVTPSLRHCLEWLLEQREKISQYNDENQKRKLSKLRKHFIIIAAETKDDDLIKTVEGRLFQLERGVLPDTDCEVIDTSLQRTKEELIEEIRCNRASIDSCKQSQSEMQIDIIKGSEQLGHKLDTLIAEVKQLNNNNGGICREQSVPATTTVKIQFKGSESEQNICSQIVEAFRRGGTSQLSDAVNEVRRQFKSRDWEIIEATFGCIELHIQCSSVVSLLTLLRDYVNGNLDTYLEPLEKAARLLDGCADLKFETVFYEETVYNMVSSVDFRQFAMKPNDAYNENPDHGHTVGTNKADVAFVEGINVESSSLDNLKDTSACGNDLPEDNPNPETRLVLLGMKFSHNHNSDQVENNIPNTNSQREHNPFKDLVKTWSSLDLKEHEEAMHMDSQTDFIKNDLDDGETEKLEKESVGVSIDTCERRQKRKRWPGKLPPGFCFNEETRKFRKDTHVACKKHGSDTPGIHKTPQIKKMSKKHGVHKYGRGSIKLPKSESSSGTVGNTLNATETRIKNKNNRYVANPLPAEMEIQNQATDKKTNANEICYTYPKESRESHDTNVEADGETEDAEKKTVGVSLDTCERSQKRKRWPGKLPPGFGFNQEIRKFRKDTHGACKKHGSDTSGIHKTPQVNIAQNYKLTKHTSESVDSCFVINDHNAKKELQDDVTVSETCSNIVCSNCENPISDLEDDRIRVSGQLMSFLDHPPVPGDFPLNMPLKKNNASAVFCSCGPTQKRKLCRESKIYIAHKDQDTDKGDYFGAILRTYEEQEECVNYRHFLVDIDHCSPATEMYFKPKDEIILLNRVFSPGFNHEDLLKQFLDVKVDGRTRLELVIRRYCGDKAKNKRKQWIDISAILFPVKHEEHQASARDTKSVPLTDNSFDTFMKRLYRIPGSDYFLQISSSGVNADVIVDVHDKTKDIWKRVHYYETKSGLIVYVAALCDQTKTLYIAVDTKSIVGVSSGIYWYRFKKPGDEISFQLESNDTYFAYDLEKKEAVVQPVEFNFEEFPADAYEIKKALIRMFSASSSDSGLGASISSQSGDRAVKMTVFDNCTPLMTPLIAKSYGLCEKRYLTRSHMTTTPSTPNTPTTPLGRLTLQESNV